MQTQTDYPQPPFPSQEIGPPPGLEQAMEPRPRYEAPNYRPANKLEGKTALITGGDSGIGRAVAVLYAREGADVAFTYLPQERADAEETVNAIQQTGKQALALEGDLCNPQFCQAAVDATIQRFKKLDVLVNNAAYQQHRPGVEEVSLEQWDRTFRTNVYAYFMMVKAALPHLQPGAAIINTGSITGLEGSAELLDYSATKGAIHAFTKSLAQNLVSRGIRVNCVAPGPVWTPLNPAERTDESTREFGSQTPMKRPAQPEEVAPAFVFFASSADASYIAGEVLTLLGGETVAG